VAQSDASLQCWSVPEQAPLGPTQVSVPASPVALQHDVLLVSHIVLPHGTIPGSQPAPPSGAWQVEGAGPPPDDPSAPPPGPPSPPPPEVPPELLATPPLLPLTPPELLDPPPLLPLLPPDIPPLDPLPRWPPPPSPPVPELDVLQPVSASGSAADSSAIATIPPCIVFIVLLLRRMVEAYGTDLEAADRNGFVAGSRTPSQVDS
jgi:hypothetical protein